MKVCEVGNLEDSELFKLAREAMNDLYAAATNEPNSEWHEACFAGSFVLIEEINKRDLTNDFKDYRESLQDDFSVEYARKLFA